MVHFRFPRSHSVACWLLGAACLLATTDVSDAAVSITEHRHLRSLQEGTCPRETLVPSDEGQDCDMVDLVCPLETECPIWDGTACVDTVVESVCVCVDNVWSCNVPNCAPCDGKPSECPDENLQLSDMSGPCDITDDIVCPFDAGQCDVWDGQACVPQDIVTDCFCSGGMWTCALPSCVPCDPPTGATDVSCPEPELGENEGECAAEGLVCPLLAGECDAWNGQACVQEEVVTSCFCSAELEWICAVPRCPPCGPPITPTTECPGKPLQEADILGECDVPEGVSCPFNAGSCDVWDGKGCIAEDVITSCSCEGGEWICAIPGCAPCEPPIDSNSCPAELLQEADVNGPCDAEGLDCPFNAGQCEVWNGEACEMQDVTTSCFCEENEWICAVPDCVPCEPPTNAKPCPAEGLPSSAVSQPCESEGSECPLNGNTCDVWNGTACVPQDTEAMCVCAEMAWTCAIPDCVPCAAESLPGQSDLEPSGEPSVSPTGTVFPDTMPPSIVASDVDGEVPSNSPNGALDSSLSLLPTAVASTLDPTAVSETGSNIESFSSSSRKASYAKLLGTAVMALGWSLAVCS
jgi:hypothetical protein